MPRRITMRPRAGRSAEPIACADVNVGLIEVSPSLVKACCAVKPPSGSSGRFLRGISLERLLDDPGGGMDADDLEPLRADVLELVWRLRATTRMSPGPASMSSLSAVKLPFPPRTIQVSE